MNDSPAVVIVGAGPTGLALAALEVHVLADRHRLAGVEQTGSVADGIAGLQSRDVVPLRVGRDAARLIDRERGIATLHAGDVEPGDDARVRFPRHRTEHTEHFPLVRFRKPC